MNLQRTLNGVDRLLAAEDDLVASGSQRSKVVKHDGCAGTGQLMQDDDSQMRPALAHGKGKGVFAGGVVQPRRCSDLW
jgi:hypothetical protein